MRHQLFTQEKRYKAPDGSGRGVTIGVRMFNDAQYPPRPKEDLQAAQAASVLSRTGDRSAKKRRAEKIWFNGKLTIREKEALSGVPQSTLYHWFGKTRVPKEPGK